MVSVLFHVGSFQRHLVVSFKQEAKELMDVAPEPPLPWEVVPSRSEWRALPAMCEVRPQSPSSLSGTPIHLIVPQ